MEKKQSRKRLRPWLEFHCNENTFQGLKWIDKEKMIFRISWRHQSNRAWEYSTDAEIFKAWALFSGKFKEGDTETPPEWKTRLRTALTKLSDVEEMKGMHKLSDTENPYKVYRFLDDEEVSINKIRQHGSPSSDFGMASSPTSSYQTSPVSQTEFLDGSFDNEGALPKNNKHHEMHGTSSNIPTVVYDGEISHPIDHVMSDIDQSQGMNDFTSSNQEPCAGPSNIPFDLQQGLIEPNIVSEMHSKFPSDLESLDSNSLRCFNTKITDPISIDSSLPSVDPMMSPKVRIDIYFVDQLVKSGLFDEKGARLFCGDPPIPCMDQKVFGPEDLKQISVPDVDSVNKRLSIKEKDRDLIRNIQKNMERGLLLGCDNNNIYVQRLCKARVFAWNEEGKSARLDRESNMPVSVFDFNNFGLQLQAFTEGSHSKPSPSVNFSFGQEYKADSPGKRPVLLRAKITHLEADSLLEQIVNNDQDNSEVLISNSNSGDYLAARLKEIVSLHETKCTSIFDEH